MLVATGFTLMDVQKSLGYLDAEMTTNIYVHLDLTRKIASLILG